MNTANAIGLLTLTRSLWKAEKDFLSSSLRFETSFSLPSHTLCETWFPSFRITPNLPCNCCACSLAPVQKRTCPEDQSGYDPFATYLEKDLSGVPDYTFWDLEYLETMSISADVHGLYIVMILSRT